MIAYSQIVQLHRIFLFISFRSFKIINLRFYNILMYYSNVDKYKFVYLESFISCNEMT